MNNFLLNNTSVYLGGQCAWNVVLDKNKEEFEISGFQLTPISNNVPYNKKGNLINLNNNHSDTIKQFCSNLKESFWSTDFDADTFVTDKFDNVDIAINSSLLAGLKRESDYDIYKKQFCFFQPVWLESIPDNSYLRFKFTVYPYSNPKSILGARWVDFKLKDNYKYQFHNRFIEYLKNWFSYIHITKTDDNEGNDRVMYIDLKKEEAYLSGISIKTGQMNNHCGCDYVISNLLLYERPKVETDYILSNLFKNQNLITSQLFNFKFYLNLEDILDKFIFNQLTGQKIYVRCDCYLVNEKNEFEQLEIRSLFTNYNKVQKSEFNPFTFVDDIEFDEGGMGVIKNINYEVKSTEDYKTNVLDYLKDYEVSNVKDINKLSQNICHWNYSKTPDKNFNLYNGYQYIYDIFGDGNINNITPTSPNDPSIEKVLYEYYPQEIPYSNGVSVLSLPDNYTSAEPLSWIYPKNILYVNSNTNDVGTAPQFKDKMIKTLNNKLFNKGVIGIIYKNSLSIADANNIWGTNINPEDIAKELGFENFNLDDYNSGFNKISYVYVKNIYGSNVIYPWGEYNENINKILKALYKVYEVDVTGVTIGLDFETAVIFTNNPEMLMLDNIITKCVNYYNSTTLTGDDDIKKFQYILITLNGIKQSIQQGNDGGFYQFNNDLSIGYNDLNEEVYYKSDTRNTHVYRTGGLLRPAFLSQDSSNINDFYGLLINDKKPQLIISNGEFEKYVDFGKENEIKNGLFEISYPGGGWRYLLANELNFVLKKSTLDEQDKSLNDMIIDYLSRIYKLEESDAKKIYKLFFTSFDYEYEYDIVEGQTIIQTVYNVKLILR